MSPNRSPKFTVSTTSAWGSMEMPTFGSTSPPFSTIFHLLLSLSQAFSAFMEVYPLASTPWTKSSNSTDSWKFLMKGLFAIFFGLIQTIDVAGVSHQEVLATPLVRISLSSSTTRMILSWLQEHTNLWWTDITGHTTGTSSLFSQHRITVTDVEMRPPSWK